jgi:hypothetical protein
MSRSASDLPSDRDLAAVGRRDLLQGVAATGIAMMGSTFLASPSRANIWEEGEIQCHASSAEKNPDYDLDDAILADFMKVSRTLTGMPLSSPSDLHLGREYLERFSRIAVPTIEPRKLIAARDQTADAIMNNKEIRPAAEQLIYLWYLSAFFLDAGAGPAWVFGTADQYEHGILWKVIGAHAPMMPMRPSRPNYWATQAQLP